LSSSGVVSLEVITVLVVVCAVVQPTDEMLDLASDKRDEAMAAMADGNVLLIYCSPSLRRLVLLYYYCCCALCSLYEIDCSRCTSK